MFLGPLLVIILLVFLCSHWLTPRQSCGHHSHNPQHTVVNPPSAKRPMEILNERYAKGEIGEEEYLRIKRNLE